MRDDGVLPSVGKSPLDDDTRMGGVAKAPSKGRKKSKLDGPDAEKMLCKLRTWFDAEWQRQAHNRFQQAMDEDYYDGLQWTEEEASVLIERGARGLQRDQTHRRLVARHRAAHPH